MDGKNRAHVAYGHEPTRKELGRQQRTESAGQDQHDATKGFAAHGMTPEPIAPRPLRVGEKKPRRGGVS